MRAPETSPRSESSESQSSTRWSAARAEATGAAGAPIPTPVEGSDGADRSCPSLLLFGRSPLAPHLGEPVHVDRRLLAFVLGGKALQQLDRVGDVVLDGALGGLEIDLANLGERRPGGLGALLDRLQRHEPERLIGHRPASGGCVAAFRASPRAAVY